MALLILPGPYRLKIGPRRSSRASGSSCAPGTGLAALLMLCMLLGIGLSVASPEPAHAEHAPSEYQVKAAFIYNFVRFTEWPAGTFSDTSQPYRLCVIGENPFGGALDGLTQKQANGRSFVIIYDPPRNQLSDCHIAFVSESHKHGLSELLPLLAAAKTLSIGETTRFAEKGGIFNFFIADNKVRFQVNTDAAGKASFRISSKLLKLADVVGDSGAGR